MSYVHCMATVTGYATWTILLLIFLFIVLPDWYRRTRCWCVYNFVMKPAWKKDSEYYNEAKAIALKNGTDWIDEYDKLRGFYFEKHEE